MKRLITLAIMAVCIVVSCSKFDDSAIWDKLRDHESRIAYLEEVCKKMNTEIVNLQTIVTALETNDYIVNASPLATGDGYTFIFKSGKSVVIYNGKDGVDGTDGKDGKDGIDGVAPTISVMKDVDGIYYWTVNNEWLLVNGQKVKASATDGKDGENGTDGIDGSNGNDGITPKFKIEEDYWYISYDNGESWEKLGKATGNNGLDGINGEDGDSIFQKVTQDDKYVYFYLTDGTMITLSKHNTDIIQFEDLNVKAICCKNWDTNYDGELSYEEAAAVKEISGFSGNTTIVAFNELKHFVGLTDITSSAFSSCTSLWKIALPETIEEIGANAFYECSSLCICKIPDSVASIGNGAFRGCVNINDFYLSNNISYLGQAFTNCKGRVIVNCNILTAAFHSADFDEVIIGDDVRTIGSMAFYACDQIIKLTIGKSVEAIGGSAFAQSSELKEVYCMSGTPPTLDGTKVFTSSTCTFYVPQEALDKYKNASGWNVYAEKIVGYNY